MWIGKKWLPARRQTPLLSRSDFSFTVILWWPLPRFIPQRNRGRCDLRHTATHFVPTIHNAHVPRLAKRQSNLWKCTAVPTENYIQPK